MSRISRKNYTSNYYHVMVQGINKEFIFNKKTYMEEYKKIIHSKLENSNIIILAYCIMNNHTHFLIHTEKVEYLSKFMQKINTSFSNYYNKIQDRVGYVFRDRFRIQTILNQKHLFNCLYYIHNNPVKAGIVNNIEDYQFSSYNEFFNNNYIINDYSIKLLFDTSTNYLERFKNIHQNYNSEDVFIDIKDKNIHDFLYEMEKQLGINKLYFKKDKKILEFIIKESRAQTDVTIRELAKLLSVSKSTIEKYCKIK